MENAKLTKLDLYLEQKRTLDTFLEKGAISKAQHDYSLGCLKRKMGFENLDAEPTPTTNNE